MPDGGHLFFGGSIWTVDEACPSPRAVAIRDGSILAVGSEAECRAALGTDFAETDLEGRALLPGFIDTHLHPVVLIYFDLNTDVRDVVSIAELQTRLREAEPRARPGAWVVGLQFDEQSLADRRTPTRHDLDAAGLSRPAILIQHDGHTVIACTKAIEAAGVSASTPDPAGGRIEREADGTPAGPFRETATRFPLGAMPPPELDTLKAGAAAAFRRLTSFGITSAGAILQTDAEGPAGSLGAFDIPLMQALLEQIPIPLYGILITEEADAILAARKTPLGDPASGPGHRIGGMKLFSDGTFGSCTASMQEPFSDRPDTRGFLTLGPEELYRRMQSAHTAGLQLAIHAIGDAANRLCIDLYARLLAEHPRSNSRHRLEHASLLDREMIADLARLGVVVSTQPLFIHSEKGWLRERIGAERAKRVYPYRWIVEGGVKLAGASDAPVESPDVLHAIQCCVTREGFEPEQCLTPQQAIRMYTLDAAFAQFEEAEKGSITPGKRADLVVLSANPASVPPEEIRRITVEQTIVRGRVVYDRSAGPGA
jgi:predicted amidohydrolase YtcJ